MRWVGDDNVAIDRILDIHHPNKFFFRSENGILTPKFSNVFVVSRVAVQGKRILAGIILVSDLGPIDRAAYRRGFEPDLPVARVRPEKAKVHSLIARGR